MNFRYVPVLRTKAGEAAALSNLPAQSKKRLLPIIQITSQPAATFANDIAQGWAQLPLALDGLHNFSVTNSLNDFRTMFRDLGKASIGIIPSVECATVPAYVSAVKTLVGRYGPGLVVQATIAQIPTVATWVASEGWLPADVDLVINAGHVGAYDTASFASYVTHALAQLPSGWRSIALVAAAAPKDYAAFPVGRSLAKRLDWLLWKQVHPQLSNRLDYGDYGISHPDLTEVPGVAMARASVSVRYTVDDDWIILKGNPTTGPNAKSMKQQYPAHAKALMKEPQFGGVVACWGDQRIRQIAALSPGSSGAGSRATWVSIGASRHLSLVADRLP